MSMLLLNNKPSEGFKPSEGSKLGKLERA